MSSLLNVSNDSGKSEKFSLNDIGVLADSKEQNWFKRARIGQYLLEEDKKSRAFLQVEGGIRSMGPPGKMLKTMIFASR